MTVSSLLHRRTSFQHRSRRAAGRVTALVLIGLLATIVPARRAARIDATQALNSL